MSELTQRRCQACDGKTAALTAPRAAAMLKEHIPQWQLLEDAKAIRREFKFKDFYRTMSFVNALAHIANIEDHHPDLEIGYNYCRVRYSTHAVNGLSDNDFICAARIDQILTD
jgi:4a-hydroxytetrahydrobiopterin dehydratase